MEKEFDIKKCKPFDLEKAMAGDPVVMRNGTPYKFGAYNKDARGDAKLIGWDNDGFAYTHLANGNFLNGDNESDNDLFMAPKTRTVYVNFAKYESGNILCLGVYDTEQSAKINSLVEIGYTYVAIAAPIEIEE
jgi:hypothetical protein